MHTEWGAQGYDPEQERREFEDEQPTPDELAELARSINRERTPDTAAAERESVGLSEGDEIPQENVPSVEDLEN